MARERGRRGAAYPVGMARSPLTLAALATAAVRGIDVSEAARFGPAAGAADRAVLETREHGRVIVRVPRGEAESARQSSEVAALAALTAGVRARLPFAVHTVLGQAPIDGTRAVVTDFLPGVPLKLSDLTGGEGVSASVGRALAAVHTLPTSLATDASLPVTRPLDTLATTVSLMDRASSTGLVPAALIDRWEAATEDPALWQFAPTVVHGSMSAEVVLVRGTAVTGVVDWSGLQVGDPARDLSWVLGATDPDAADSAFDAYNLERGSSDRQVRKRATLYAELEIARWLLHGTQERDTAIVDDAVGMLHNLVDLVQHDLGRRIDTDTRPVLTVTEVEELLDRDRARES